MSPLVPANDNLYANVALIDNTNTAFGFKLIDGKPRVSTMPYLYDIAEGNVSGHTSFAKIGYTPTMTTTESDLWSKAGAYVFPAAAMQMAVVSSDNTQDKAGGSGALKVTIYYLDANYIERTEEVTLTGTSAVNTTATNILRVNGFRVTAAGATGKPLGNLSLTSVGGGVTYSYISAGYTRARNSAYTVPALKTLYVVSISFGYGYATNQTHYSRLYLRANQNEGVLTPGIFYPQSEVMASNATVVAQFPLPLKFIEKVDLKISGISTFAGIATSSLRGWIE